MKKMNSLSIVFMVLTFICCQNSNEKIKTLKNIEKIQIKSISFFITTIVSVECDRFEDYFKEPFTNSITDTVEINKLLKIIDKMEPIDSTYSNTVDVRAKINLFSKQDTNTICVGYLTVSMNNEIYKTPSELVDFIEAKFDMGNGSGMLDSDN